MCILFYPTPQIVFNIPPWAVTRAQLSSTWNLYLTRWRAGRRMFRKGEESILNISLVYSELSVTLRCSRFIVAVRWEKLLVRSRWAWPPAAGCVCILLGLTSDAHSMILPCIYIASTSLCLCLFYVYIYVYLVSTRLPLCHSVYICLHYIGLRRQSRRWILALWKIKE